ncbi:hypothetical protein QTJ16_005673 [Diplocarpon rosae]|uniref:COP9 signalosome complex subunit 3 N-terminal helical repeats domain-containing protein n=1 Tax=Diplocarpon rosae TaxID=946125 RepID=A0AAD9SY81_9HELO|nr:hypothetical protein QTJ16_005673 [Diplocarpon rosae]
MDDLLPKILSFPPHPPPAVPLSDLQYDEGISNQIEILKKISDSKFMQQTSGGEHILDVIDPALNTVSYAFILIAHLNAYFKNNSKSADMDTLWGKLVNFLSVFDPRQMRYMGDELSHIIKKVSHIARDNQQAHLAVLPVKNALMRLDPSGSVLTSNHIILAKLALESGAYHDALPVLDKFILFFPVSSSPPKPKYLCDMSLSPATFLTHAFKHTAKLKYQEILEYFLWSAMAQMAAHNWDGAMHCLESVVTYPTRDGGVSKIQVEAYKKWVLVGLLREGKLLPLPKSTSITPAKVFHIMAKPYETLAQIFENGTASRLRSEAEIGTSVWLQDGNTGLIKFVLAAYQKFQIRALAQVYSKISIPEILSSTTSAETGARLSSPQACENIVQGMITHGELQATLSNPPTGHSILTFSPSGAALTEVQMQRELAASTVRIQTLTKEIKHTDRILTHDKEYIKYLQKLKKAGNKAIEDGQSEWQDLGDDEDIMGGTY